MFEIPTEQTIETKKNSPLAPLRAEVIRNKVAEERSVRISLEDHARRHAFAEAVRKISKTVLSAIWPRHSTDWPTN